MLLWAYGLCLYQTHVMAFCVDKTVLVKDMVFGFKNEKVGGQIQKRSDFSHTC